MSCLLDPVIPVDHKSDEPERRRVFNLVALNVACVAAEGHVPRVSPVPSAEALVQRQLRQQLPGGPTAGSAGLFTEPDCT